MAVINQKIYLSDPVTFNDPWDCRPFFYIPTENEVALRENYIQWLDTNSRTHNHEIPEAEHLRNVVNLRRDQTYFESVVKQISESMGNAISHQYRVYCLSTQSDSALMWSHYANNHQGVCLEFRCDNEIFGSAMKINYADEYPQFDFTNDDILSLVTKSRVWSYEDEYRVVALERFVGPPVAGVLRTRKNFLRMPRHALQSVIMGCMITTPRSLRRNSHGASCQPKAFPQTSADDANQSRRNR